MAYEGSILIVDDEPSARDTLEAFLMPEGYTLSFATNGAQALDMAAQLTPDLILLDVMMPDLDGFEVCRRLRADPALAAIHIVMITALDDRDSRLRGLEAGADDFLSKPFDGAELQVRVRTVMQLSRYRHLLEERSRFEWVVEHAESGYLMIDAAGQVLYANSWARQYLDISVDDIKGTFLDLVKQQYNLEPQQAWERWPHEDDPATPRYLVRPETGLSSLLWLQVDVVEMRASGAPQYLVQLRDVTETILTRNRGWTFDAQISHKVKTPLNQLAGTLQLLDFDFDELSRDEIRADLVEAYQGAMRLKARILDIFQYLEALQSAQISQDTCKLGYLPALLERIKVNLNLDTVTLTTDEVPQDVSLPLACNLVGLILGELMENAKKFHPQEAPTLEVHLATVEQSIRLRVQDDGVHMPSSELDKLWWPYYQMEGRFTGEVPGMGLGLAVVSSLVWSVGGTCQARNREDGPGLVIELVFPFVAASF